MRGHGRFKKPRGPIRLPAHTSQEEATAVDVQEHEPQLPRTSMGLGDMELQIWVPFASGVQPCHSDLLHPLELCSRRITLIIEERLIAEGHCWKTVPNDTKEFYWQEFKKYLLWDQAINSLVKIVWQKKAAERYRGLMWEIRKGKTKNLATLDSVLRKWQETWNTSEYKEKCDKFSANRCSEARGAGSDISRHACESVSQYTHRQRMRERLGRKRHPHELFKATHKRKGTEEFIDIRSKAIYKKSRVNGLGSQASAYFHETSHCFASYTSAPQVDPPTIEAMSNMQNKIDRLETENGRLNTVVEELQAFMHRMMAQQGVGISTQTSALRAPPVSSPQ
ncbi:uncharacterized protein LOC110623255 [Manihot esculenta]|uniref:uncharacterized protein LOC110623255 n=1 Tax=Manihot esculenta TaxID=3983 RepID=UPI000B5D2912|nr:uncharacterized protein LOC110623255 [Manihot esculenta]